MSQEIYNAPATEDASTQAIPKRCPICGDLMHQGVVDGIDCWICNTPEPECGYFEPI